MIDTVVLQIAKTVILSKFDTSFSIDKGVLLKQYPFLNDKGAAFVTLHYDKQLRGCIGSIIAHTSLLDDIISNALSAAFRDPRFAPLEDKELGHLTLEVSVLTPPQEIEYLDFKDLTSKIVPSEDGLILQYGQYQGTFLPQVWEQLATPKEFLEHLSYKANANPSIYTHHPSIYKYRVEAREEKFNAIQPL